MPQLPAATTDDHRHIDEAAAPPQPSRSLMRAHRVHRAFLVNRVGRSQPC